MVQLKMQQGVSCWLREKQKSVVCNSTGIRPSSFVMLGYAVKLSSNVPGVRVVNCSQATLLGSQV